MQYYGWAGDYTGAGTDTTNLTWFALSGATPCFMGVPFFYFPYWRREFDEHYGWRFEPGYESDLGAYLLSTYQFQLIDFGGENNNSLDSRSHFDYRTERGWALGQDLVAGPEDNLQAAGRAGGGTGIDQVARHH